MKTLLVVAGLGQLGLVGASTLIPRLLHWREETAKLRPLTRQVVTIYALCLVGTSSHLADHRDGLSGAKELRMPPCESAV